ncbi:bifunctional diguanylate cyclase/phosphodiesterase [Butyrivibrio sp. MC2021]|uniref:bifunctional diguanylate cyclase/phosphodiesterase n=1 Tax=Butyrivibrio sp. MC2021 TaxID=1408306 RepID=UPI000479C64A|nr:bifunctional diguanylate cyclase/phosphodiesterase [Butyrivibrio sp. MC2021]
MVNLDQCETGKAGNIDELTGLLNLTGILDVIRDGGQDLVNEGAVIIYLNVMNFKAFNQRYGFAGGNEFLRGLAREIQGIFSDDFAARTSGDQFIILTKSLEKEEILKKLKALDEAAVKYEKGLHLRIKAGIYQATGKEQDSVILIDRAKIACDDVIRVYDKDYNFYSEELSKKNELKQYVIDNFENAFKQRYFKVYYQKEVRALTGKVCGYEALARWIDPQYGIISPAIFVEVLESVHLVHKLDTYIIEQVCHDLRQDIDYGLAVMPVSVNLSRLDFELCDIFSEVNKCREKYDIPVNLINIEITESAIAAGENFLNDQIKKFREEGYQVWMDDFGAGYSSLNNLKIYDFDMLKIDMNFLRDFETNQRTKVILSSIVNMAKELGIHTLAEGVETREQYEFLRRIGCERLQGYLFGKPKPVDEMDFAQEYSFENCEDCSLNGYYDDIGEVNFMGTTPLREKNMEVFNNLPIAVLEIVDDKMSFLYANSAYEEVLSSIGISSLAEADKRNANRDLNEVKRLLEMAKVAEKAYNHRAEGDFIVNGSVLSTKMRFLSRHGEKAAVAIVTRNLTVYGDSKLADNIHVAMAHVFSQYFRVDLYDEDGTVDNIFLNGDQLPVTDVERNAVMAVQLYSNMYLYKEERERFRKFYDITTANDRVKESGRQYIVDYYHSAIPGDGGRMQMYMILPFYYNNRWKYISCCRYADEISDELIYGNS